MSAITAIGPPLPLPGVSQIGVGFSDLIPRSSQIGGDFSFFPQIGVGLSENRVAWPPRLWLWVFSAFPCVLCGKKGLGFLANCYLLAARLSKTVQLLLFLTGRQISNFTICSPKESRRKRRPWNNSSAAFFTKSLFVQPLKKRPRFRS